MRRAAKRDGNEPELAKIPPLYGWTLRKLSDTGKPDWLCMRHGRVVFIEIKDKGGTLTPAQEKEFPLFEAAGCHVHVCRTEDDVRRALGAPVEGVLGPLEKMERLHAHVAKLARDGAGIVIPVHPANAPLLADMVAAGHLVTPAYQKAQTDAVVPPPRSGAKSKRRG
jgi:hypothetical protein